MDNRRVVGQSAVVTDAPDATKHTDHAYGESGRDVMWFGVWSVIGAAYALAVIGAMTIGVFVLPVAVLATVFTGRHRRAAVGLPGLLSGAAFPLLYVAYLNRDGQRVRDGVHRDARGSVMYRRVESMAMGRHRRTSGGRCDRVCPTTKHSAP